MKMARDTVDTKEGQIMNTQAFETLTREAGAAVTHPSVSPAKNKNN